MTGGYRPDPAGGPRIRADVIDVYVFRKPSTPAGAPAAPKPEFLQVLRSGPPLDNTWHPVMGHIEPGESAPAAAFRELREELGLTPDNPSFHGLWALEQVHPFYIAAIDSIVMSPRFAAEVDNAWSPTLNDEHAGHRWVPYAETHEKFMWPGQLACVREIIASLLPKRSLSREHLRIRPTS